MWHVLIVHCVQLIFSATHSALQLRFLEEICLVYLETYVEFCKSSKNSLHTISHSVYNSFTHSRSFWHSLAFSWLPHYIQSLWSSVFTNLLEFFFSFTFLHLHFFSFSSPFSSIYSSSLCSSCASLPDSHADLIKSYLNNFK